MAQLPGDNKTEPSLELPSLKLPGLGRRRRKKVDEAAGTTHAPLEDPTPADVPLAEPRTDAVDERTEVVEEPQPQTGNEPTQSWDRAATRTLPLEGTDVPAKRAGTRRPALPGWLAAGLTGLLVGAAGAAGTYGAMAACEAVRGVSSCGGAPGFFILVAIVVLMVLLGAGLLRAFGVEETGSTSFLAVGIVTVLVMLLLLDVIFSAWMFAVIPALTAAAYLLARWVTTRFADEDTGRRDWR